MRVLVTDPTGAQHMVLFTQQGVYGHENLGHPLDTARETVVRDVLGAIFVSPEAGTFKDYVWQVAG